MLCHLWRALFKGQEYIAIKKIQISGLKEVHRRIKNLTVGNFLVIQEIQVGELRSHKPCGQKKKRAWLCPALFPWVFLSSRYLAPNSTKSPSHFPSSSCFLSDNSLGSYLYFGFSLALMHIVSFTWFTETAAGKQVKFKPLHKARTEWMANERLMGSA